MPLIIVVTIIVYMILLGWTWSTLGDLDRIRKIIIIFFEVLIMYIITLIIFGISENGLVYTSKDAQNDIRNVMVIIFAGINSLIVIPYINKQIIKLKEKEIEKENLIRKSIVLCVIFVIFLVIECGYMKDTQKGIIKMEQVYVEQNKS